uniref:Uncharacterized protein n=1 Tax=Xiphophorus couchianus TaxID=32473 RepID=A0A3B5KQU9_9TELE
MDSQSPLTKNSLGKKKLNNIKPNNFAEEFTEMDPTYSPGRLMGSCWEPFRSFPVSLSYCLQISLCA